MNRRGFFGLLAPAALVLVGGPRFLEAQRPAPVTELQANLRAWGKAFLAWLGWQSPARVGMPYFVGMHGPELFTPSGPVALPRPDIDYNRLAEAIARAMQETPLPQAIYRG